MAAKCSSGQATVPTDHMVHMRSHRGHRNHRHDYANHRKSAVELLEASKSVYVKSSEVLNHQQQLKHPENLSIKNIDIISLSVSPAKHSTLEDESNILTEQRLTTIEEQKGTNAQKSSNDQCGFEHSSAHESHVTFKKPSIPPKPGAKPPSVPPRPSCAIKPGSPPAVGPKPPGQSPTFGKPLPPPRAGRKPSVPEPSDSTGSMSASDRKSVTSPATTTSASLGGNASPDSSNKRYSSVSASASINVSKCDKEPYSNAPSTASSMQSHEARHSVHSDSFLKPLNATNLSTSVGILVETKRMPMARPRRENQSREVVDQHVKRQLHRSHSDLSSCRHSRASSDFSDLSSRVSRTSTEVERFFNEMGIDRTVLEPMRKLSELKQKDLLDSLSSLESIGAQSASSQLSQNEMDRLPMESEQDLLDRAGATSVVERNARIIKWLCNVKKASSAPKPGRSAAKQPDSRKKTSKNDVKADKS